jgi:hypothetical protein
VPDRSPVLERYFDALRTHGWESLAGCLSDDVHRTGPYLDVDGVRTEFPEALVFDFAPDGRIQRVDIFIKQPPSRRKEGA